MGCATGTIKYSLFLFNTLWTIVGFLVIIFAILGWNQMPQNYAIGILVTGGFILLISLFGCFGAIRESARMLWTYASFLLVLLVLIILMIIFGSSDVFKNYAIDTVKTLWNKEMINQGAMDTIQQTYKCCGLESAEDYITNRRMLPSSCCKDNNCINPMNLFITGCIAKVELEFADESTTTKYVQFGLLGFNILILVLTSILAIHYTNRRRRYNY